MVLKRKEVIILVIQMKEIIKMSIVYDLLIIEINGCGKELQFILYKMGDSYSLVNVVGIKLLGV